MTDFVIFSSEESDIKGHFRQINAIKFMIIQSNSKDF